MAKKSATRTVQCYHCDHVFDIPRDAMTTSCPSCFKRVVIEDIVVRHAQGNTVLGTCGRLIVQPRASVVARRIRAIEGVEIQGTIESAVETEGEVRLTPTAKWKGDCTARSLLVEPGASISGGFFSIGGPKPERTAHDDDPEEPPEATVEGQAPAKAAGKPGARSESEPEPEPEPESESAAVDVEATKPAEGVVPRRSAGTSSTRVRPPANRAPAPAEPERAAPRKTLKQPEPKAPARGGGSPAARAKPASAKPKKPGGA